VPAADVEIIDSLDNFDPADTTQVIQLGVGLELRWVKIAELKEQDVNAQIMMPDKFERLTENIRERGIVESLPYCYDPRDGTPIQIVSGHHRTRAARNAGLDIIPVLVDTLEMSASQVASKQIAHNALVGQTDADVLSELLKAVSDNVDDLLRTGLSEAELPHVGKLDVPLDVPRGNFDFRTISFTFLPHQFDAFKAVVDSLPPSDMVGVASMEQYEAFTKAVSEYIRVKDVRHVGTVLSILTRLAEEAVADHEDE